MKKDIPGKWNFLKIWSSNTYARKNRLENKDCNKKQRKIIHND